MKSQLPKHLIAVHLAVHLSVLLFEEHCKKKAPDNPKLYFMREIEKWKEKALKQCVSSKLETPLQSGINEELKEAIEETVKELMETTDLQEKYPRDEHI